MAPGKGIGKGVGKGGAEGREWCRWEEGEYKRGAPPVGEGVVSILQGGMEGPGMVCASGSAFTLSMSGVYQGLRG